MLHGQVSSLLQNEDYVTYQDEELVGRILLPATKSEMDDSEVRIRPTHA